jgi:mono/diheme cytochrome c family protein
MGISKNIISALGVFFSVAAIADTVVSSGSSAALVSVGSFAPESATDLSKIIKLVVDKQIMTYTIEQFINEPQIKKITLTILEPHENFSKTNYSGFETKSVLNYIYGEQWQKSELIVFKCADGYQDLIPIDNLKTHDSILAYKKEAGTFSLYNKGQKEQITDLGPYYLVWDNKRNQDLKTDGATHWPYQIVEIELAQFKDKFPKMVPQSSELAITNGFKHFQKHCMSCHKINGEGGSKGPDLNLPVNIFDRLDEKTVRAKINNPQSINPQSTMPPLNRSLKARNKVIEEIIAYLQVMKSK